MSNAIAAQLRALADQLDNAGPNPAEPPEGMVAVVPTGPEGRGKVRFWPAALQEDSNAWSYVIRVSQMTDPTTGQPFYPPDQTGAFGMLSGAAHDFVPRHSFETLADYVLHPRDWWPQWMIDNDAGRPSGTFSPR